MPSIASTISVGFGSWGGVSDTVSVGFGFGEAPIAAAGSLRVAAVESRPGIRIRDMVVPSISVQGLETDSAGIAIGSVEIIP